MNENIDLTKILKNCPKGWKFYSSTFGEVEFIEIRDDEYYPIITKKGVYNYNFTAEGFYCADEGEECLLFPSKDQRDWTKFTAPWYQYNRFNPKTLKQLDKVLVRNSRTDPWICASYIRTNKSESIFKYVTWRSAYEYCIPYNDDTKHLVGTTDEAPEYYRYW